ncbi:MAG: TlpA family protein disulfide reductase [Hydrogenophilales bacterium]|nr:TlpA family protein disulfide reductase [Hydrogenophilales bacterium]
MSSRLVRIASQVCYLVGAISLLALLGACGKPAALLEVAEDQPFPELILTGLDGAPASTQAFRGKLLVLNVWATWCPPCRKEMPSLEQLSKTVGGGRIAVVGMSIDGDAKMVREFLTQNDITFRNFIDSDKKIAGALGVRAYPETFLIAPDGKLVRKIMGEQNWSSPAMLQVLEDAYQGRRSQAGGWAYGSPQR